MGVVMLPRLAAMVWSATTGISRSSLSASRSTSRAKGTKVMSATSLVTAILVKKGRKTRAASSCRVVAVRTSRASPSRRNTPRRCSPAMTAIRANSSIRVFQSI